MAASPYCFVDLHRQAGADPVALQEDHDLFDLFLLLPGAGDPAGAPVADAGHLPQAMRGVFDHIQGLHPKDFDDAFGGDRADALDQAAAQVFADAFDGGGQEQGEVDDFELPPVLWVGGPQSLQPHGCARRHP